MIGVIGAIDGEKDPRNLLVVFALIHFISCYLDPHVVEATAHVCVYHVLS